jgi:hypothetical protein
MYSNTAYALLGMIVSRVSGQSHREFAHTHIFGPLGMHDTYIEDDHRKVVKRRTSAYEARPDGTLRISVPVWDVSGATNLYTTAGDLLKWEQNLVDGRVGGQAIVGTMQAPGHLDDGSTTDYGFGLVLEPYRGIRTISHSGADSGFRAEAVRFPDHDLSVVTLCNLTTINPRMLNRKVAEIVLGPAAFAPLAPALAIPRGELESLVGTYWNAATNTAWRIQIRNEHLSNDSGIALLALGAGRFRVEEQTTELKFAVTKIGAFFEASGGPPWLKPTRFVQVSAPSYAEADLQAFAGEYRNDDLPAGYSIVVTPAHRLSLSGKKIEPVVLEAVMRDVFTAPGLGAVTFVRAHSGAVTGLVNGNDRTSGVPFKRLTR